MLHTVLVRSRSTEYVLTFEERSAESARLRATEITRIASHGTLEIPCTSPCVLNPVEYIPRSAGGDANLSHLANNV